jgi:peptide/nickel transport system permease protein
LVGLVVVLFCLAIAVFLLVRLVPGDPAVRIAGASATPDEIAAIRHGLGLDDPLFHQFSHYMGDLFHGEFGDSYFFHGSVHKVITDRIGSSTQLAVASLAVVLVVSVAGGMVAGALTRDGRHRFGEFTFAGTTSVIGSLPEFLMATLLVLVFAVHWRIFPVASGGGLKGLILPVTAVSLRPAALLLRIVRVETLNVLATDYMRTARGKRLPFRRTIFRHALPHVLTAALTIGGLLFAGLVGGAVVVENVFARPGLGTALVNAVIARDYPVVQGITFVLGAVVVLVTVAVDVVAALIDPRSIVRKV